MFTFNFSQKKKERKERNLKYRFVFEILNEISKLHICQAPNFLLIQINSELEQGDRHKQNNI